MGRLTRVICVAAAGVGLALPSTASAHTTTRATIFHAFTADGTPTVHTRSKHGYCWTGSLTINRDDAWRCFVGNFIYDPCFSSPQARGVVVCPNVQVNGGIEIRLTKALPHGPANNRAPSLNDQPWNIELTNGHHCVLLSGATTVIQGKRLNYGCAGGLNYALWGFPRRRSEPWTILVAPFTTKSLHGQRAIRHVWM